MRWKWLSIQMKRLFSLFCVSSQPNYLWFQASAKKQTVSEMFLRGSFQIKADSRVASNHAIDGGVLFWNMHFSCALIFPSSSQSIILYFWMKDSLKWTIFYLFFNLAIMLPTPQSQWKQSFHVRIFIPLIYYWSPHRTSNSQISTTTATANLTFFKYNYNFAKTAHQLSRLPLSHFWHPDGLKTYLLFFFLPIHGFTTHR